MGYMHIDNLYKTQTILTFKECYALEKVHGTSAKLIWHTSEGGLGLTYNAGGASHEVFKGIFDDWGLQEAFKALGHPDVTVFGEAYGGKMQGMKATYGDKLAFIVFDVKVGDTWLSVPDAEDVAKKLGLEFVPYERVPTDLASLDAQRDRPSRVAERRGCGTDKIAEGVVLRPLLEFTDNRGNRIISKHKRAEFSERSSKRDTIVDPGKLEVLTKADSIAAEWVTPTRMEHVLDKLQASLGRQPVVTDTKTVIEAMLEDVTREAKGEIVESKEATKAIMTAAAKLFQVVQRQRLVQAAGA
jgi:hypothetical protein